MSSVFIFPGQGSQKIGMLASAYQTFPVVKDAFIQASEALGFDLWDVVANGPEETLNRTEITQPAVLAASIALYSAYLDANGSLPEYLAGHSLGEYSALVAAEVISFQDAVKLVHLRGRLMQNAVPQGEGKMAAVLGLSDEEVIVCCQAVTDGVADAVNFNAPGQVVIAGHTSAIDKAEVLCKEKGAKRVLPVAVSVPAHSRLMKPAADELAKAIAAIEFNEPSIPVVQNVTALPPADLNDLKSNLLEQLYSPVKWTQTIAWLANNGVNRVVECGPGKVLSGLVKRTDKSLSVIAIEEPEVLRDLASEA